MSFSQDEKFPTFAEYLNLYETEAKLPTISFTEAVRKLDLDGLKEPVQNFSESTENFSGLTVESAKEYDSREL